ncbi:MAG: hypothetical protein U0835_17985 [Isosphaeraceae bacterium]
MNVRTLVRGWAVLAVAVVAADARKAGAADPAADLTARGLSRSGSVFVLKAEDDVFKAVAAVQTRMKEFRSEKNANRSDAEKKALAAELSARRNVLQRQMNQAVPQLRAQIQALTMQQAALAQQQNAGQFGADRGNVPLSAGQSAYQIGVLNEQIARLQAEGEQLTAEYNELNSQINELTSSLSSTPEKPAQRGRKAPVSEAEKRLQALKDAAAEARKVVDETEKAYKTLAADRSVKSAARR